MEKTLLLGDEAIAQGAIDAGVSGVYAYPGTPSTEIMEYVIGSAEAKEKKIRSRLLNHFQRRLRSNWEEG